MRPTYHGGPLVVDEIRIPYDVPAGTCGSTCITIWEGTLPVDPPPPDEPPGEERDE